MRTAHKKGTKHQIKYGHHERITEVGMGSLRVRKKLERTFGRCQGWCDRRRDDEELYGGLCSLCRWMTNDKEVGEDWYK